VNDQEIDEILARAAQRPDKLEPALLERVAAFIKPSLQPVRPLPPTWALAGGLILICAAVALAGAARAGFYGIEQLNLFERALIFPALAILMACAGIEFVSEMIPGSRRRVTSGAFLAIGCAVLLCVFGFVFRDYHTDHFVHAGIACLATGILHAIPAALLSWLLLRRGFAVNAVAAGLAVGTLSGLAGVTMLELHCANFQALHILVWHIGVVLLSGALGALAAWASRFRGRNL
jgi:hypothetical protein